MRRMSMSMVGGHSASRCFKSLFEGFWIEPLKRDGDAWLDAVMASLQPSEGWGSTYLNDPLSPATMRRPQRPACRCPRSSTLLTVAVVPVFFTLVQEWGTPKAEDAAKCPAATEREPFV